jgi:hypothetical protein
MFRSNSTPLRAHVSAEYLVAIAGAASPAAAPPSHAAAVLRACVNSLLTSPHVILCLTIEQVAGTVLIAFSSRELALHEAVYTNRPVIGQLHINHVSITVYSHGAHSCALQLCSDRSAVLQAKMEIFDQGVYKVSGEAGCPSIDRYHVLRYLKRLPTVQTPQGRLLLYRSRPC